MRQINDMPRGFKGIWIPREIWFAENLTYAEIILLSEINSLDNDKERGCIASNEYLALFLGVKVRVIQEHIKNLKDKRYLIQCFFNGRIRGLRVDFPMIVVTEGRVDYVKIAKEVESRGDENPHLSDDESPHGRHEGERKSSIRENKDKIKDTDSSQASECVLIYKELKDWYVNKYPEHFTKKDWVRESPAIKKFAERAVEQFPGDIQKAKDWISDIDGVFQDMCSGKIKHFLKNTPPIPSALMSKGIWPRVIEEYARIKGGC